MQGLLSLINATLHSTHRPVCSYSQALVVVRRNHHCLHKQRSSLITVLLVMGMTFLCAIQYWTINSLSNEIFYVSRRKSCREL